MDKSLFSKFNNLNYNNLNFKKYYDNMDKTLGQFLNTQPKSKFKQQENQFKVLAKIALDNL